jgi:hypothetical protein
MRAEQSRTIPVHALMLSCYGYVRSILSAVTPKLFPDTCFHRQFFVVWYMQLLTEFHPRLSVTLCICLTSVIANEMYSEIS